MPRRLISLFGAVALLAAIPAAGGAAGRRPEASGRAGLRAESREGFVPAVARQRQIGRYFVLMRQASVADRLRARGALAPSGQEAVAEDALASQEGAIAQARSLGGRVLFRYKTLINGFSARLSPQAASALAERGDVELVEPVAIVQKLNETSVPFIGATKVHRRFGVRGQGMRVAVVDTGVDYTHANFGGPGTVEAYESNDPTFVEPGTFPTAKVVDGYDFVGENYDVLDDDPSNDIPIPDEDPLDFDGHGSHTAGTCCGKGVPGEIGAGVAPAAKVLAIKVWDAGNSTDDVLVQGYEFAVDPNGDGDTSDAVDVLSFSGGVTYGTLNSVEARAAQRVVDIGTVFVASAGNSGNQPIGGSAYVVGTPATARGVIAVAASIDELRLNEIVINSSDPPGFELPEPPYMVPQPWGHPELLPHTDDLTDGREFDDATQNPADAHFCDPINADLSGMTVLIYKGSTGAGDCDGSLKVFNAQEAGADAVILVSLFGGLPFALAPGGFGDQIDIPVVMISGENGQAIMDFLSPGYPGTFNTQTINATLSDETVVAPEFEDALSDFTSEGPARLTSDLKPDISAPGVDIMSTAAGTGDKGTLASGTSMAAPHVSGVATLLRQLRPDWSPAVIKGVLMNQAVRALKDNNLDAPVSATVMGAGRVDAFQSAQADSVAVPGSLSFGLEHLTETESETHSFTVRNYDRRSHSYTVTAKDRYSDFDPAMTGIRVSTNGSSFGTSRSFSLRGGRSQRVWVRLRLNPSVITPLEQEFGLYYFHPNMDGSVVVRQSGGTRDSLLVPWHVAPLAASADSLSAESLDLTGGPQTLELVAGGAAQSWADLYVLGAEDPIGTRYEEDLLAVGARSFTGSTIDGEAEGEPDGTDPLGGITWVQFLTNADEPTEPVQFGAQFSAVHNTTETLEVDVLIDVGGDGVFANEEIGGDFLVVKTPEPGGNVLVFDLGDADPFGEPEAVYFQDHSNYNAHTIGLAVDASAIGLSDGTPNFTYMVTACTGLFSGDVPQQRCDSAGELANGTYSLAFDATDPALDIDPLVCGGYWGTEQCDAADPITVSTGSAGPDDDPGILALFPNNPPPRDATVVTTDT
jgi:minor extracellular serine protease Vpr